MIKNKKAFNKFFKTVFKMMDIKKQKILTDFKSDHRITAQEAWKACEQMYESRQCANCLSVSIKKWRYKCYLIYLNDFDAPAVCGDYCCKYWEPKE